MLIYFKLFFFSIQWIIKDLIYFLYQFLYFNLDISIHL